MKDIGANFTTNQRYATVVLKKLKFNDKNFFLWGSRPRKVRWISRNYKKNTEKSLVSIE
ncbi:hypothetical protein HCUR_00247 [Holospora curviuscula]|uniref:Uncharacterized protein n=1 Tax=Holospora curviuscula TaxID=1082868 RepID=A0A2S5RE25_9PROT|nr:hypothetical protein HCUR_00247 [Holospora curviuscula]